MAKTGNSQRVQDLLISKYFEPARRRRVSTVQVVAGDLARELGLSQRVPQVCSAMQGQRFLREQGLEIVKREGPPSGQGTTVALTYKLNGTSPEDPERLWQSLRGIFREAFAEEGGGEAWLKRERAAWSDKPEP